MNSGFSVERVALHLVDRQLPGPQFAEQEVDLAAFHRPEDVEALQGFFSGHLNEVWMAQEGRRTRAASFTELADMRQYYEELLRDTPQFFQRSRDMAQRLHDVSRGRRTSRGLLMVLWLRSTGDERQFLGLFKMDPGRSDKITLRQDEVGNVLLDLAVRHIEQALPDPGDRILKWAVIPHPTRPAVEFKVKDQESGAAPAQYFMTFLGCEARPSEKQQARGILEALPTYAQEYHAEEDWETAVREVVEELEEEPVITPEVVVEIIQELDVLDGFQEVAFRDKLVEFEAEELYVSSAILRAAKVQYRLPSGIIIKGPRAAMESLIQIVPMDGDIEFRIRTPSYKKSYVY